jgi:hypothetical protein
MVCWIIRLPGKRNTRSYYIALFNKDGSDFKTGKVLAIKGARHVYYIAKHNLLSWYVLTILATMFLHCLFFQARGYEKPVYTSFQKLFLATVRMVG